MILSDPDLREKNQLGTRDVRDIFRRNAGNSRKVFMELVENGKIKDIFTTILQKTISPARAKEVDFAHVRS